MSSSLDSAPCKEYLPDVYRFAFLMTGHPDAAAEVLRRTVERAARGGIGDLRDPRRARRWLFAEARHHCGGPLPDRSVLLPPVPGEHGASGPLDPASHAPAVDRPLSDLPDLPDLPAPPGTRPSAVEPSAHALATVFHALPERERSALILFYLYLFDPADLAETLELPPELLGPILARGRALLLRELGKPLPAAAMQT